MLTSHIPRTCSQIQNAFKEVDDVYKPESAFTLQNMFAALNTFARGCMFPPINPVYTSGACLHTVEPPNNEHIGSGLLSVVERLLLSRRLSPNFVEAKY